MRVGRPGAGVVGVISGGPAQPVQCEDVTVAEQHVSEALVIGGLDTVACQACRRAAVGNGQSPPADVVEVSVRQFPVCFFGARAGTEKHSRVADVTELVEVAHTCGIVTNRIAPVHIPGVDTQSGAEHHQIIPTGNAPRVFPGRAQRREYQYAEDSDKEENDEELNQGEHLFPPSGLTPTPPRNYSLTDRETGTSRVASAFHFVLPVLPIHMFALGQPVTRIVTPPPKRRLFCH